MTDREPDDLYDALRDRLADYGQEPPAPLWAGIRAQLPPPVAQSKLRRRRAGLLALLLLVVSVGGWQWWQMGHKNGQAGTEVAAVNHPKSGNQTASRRPVNNPKSTHNTAIDTDATAPQSAATRTQTSTATVEKSAASEPTSTSMATGATSKTITASAETSTTSASAEQDANGLAMSHGAGKSIATTSREATGLAAGSSLGMGSSAIASSRKAGKAVVNADVAISRPSAAARSQSRTTTRRESLASTAARQQNSASRQPGKASLLAGNVSRKPSREKYSSSTPTEIGATKTAATIAHTPTTATAGTALQSADGAENMTEKTSTQLARSAAGHQSHTSANHPDKALGAAAVALSQPTTTDEPTAATTASFVAWSRLQPRPVALALLPWARPMVQPVADTVPHLPSTVVRRWAVQVLAGPALTYRQLGSNGFMAAAPTSTTNYVNYNGDATSTVQQERPALGFGAQVQLRRALNGRWAVSAGVGYQEYATSLAFQTFQTAGGVAGASPITSLPYAPDSSTTATSFHLRNTYRLLTVPVRFSYQLGVGGPRFRVGLLAGAEAALYLGGTTAEASSCGCQTQTWGRTGSPYRSLNLALNLGLDLRYRLTPRWELLAQPMATGFLTSLARPGSGLTPRYLVGGGAMLGLSYGLQ